MLPVQGNDTELPLVPSMRGDNLYMVPQGVRPVVQLTAIEVRRKPVVSKWAFNAYGGQL